MSAIPQNHPPEESAAMETGPLDSQSLEQEQQTKMLDQTGCLPSFKSAPGISGDSNSKDSEGTKPAQRDLTDREGTSPANSSDSSHVDAEGSKPADTGSEEAIPANSGATPPVHPEKYSAKVSNGTNHVQTQGSPHTDSVSQVNSQHDVTQETEEMRGIRSESDLKVKNDSLAKENEKINERMQTLKEKQRSFEEEIKRLTRENLDVKGRLSQMASEQMRKNNPFVEEMIDPNRPTAVAEKWKALFSSADYWALYQAVNNETQNGDKTLEILYTVCKEAYDECIDFINEVTALVKQCNKTSWSSIFQIHGIGGKAVHVASKDLFSDALTWCLAEKITDKNTKLAQEISSLHSAAATACLTHMDRAVKGEQSDLDKAVVKEMSKLDVSRFLLKRINEKSSVLHQNWKFYKTFLLAVLRLYYVMRTNEFPMVAVFKPGPGDPYDPSLFECEDQQKHTEPGLVIGSVLYPPLLRQEKGAVLAKGMVTVHLA